MPFLETLSGVGSILGGLGGIFGKKPTPRSNVVSQAAGAREAAEKYGFNPLTMLQYGQPGGLAGGGAPPLASVEFLTNGLNELSAELNGDNERQRQADQLNLDLAKLKLEQARAGVAIVPTSAADGIGGGSPLGGRAATVMQSNGGQANAGFGLGSSRLGDAAPDTGAAGGSADSWTGLDPIPLQIPVRMPDGSVRHVANPDLPEAEQVAFATGVEGYDNASGSSWWKVYKQGQSDSFARARVDNAAAKARLGLSPVTGFSWMPPVRLDPPRRQSVWGAPSVPLWLGR